MSSLDFLNSISEDDLNKFRAKKEEIVLKDDDKYVINYAFANYVNVRKLTLGKNTKEICNGAFNNCVKLKEIDLGRNKNFIMEGDCLIQKNKMRLSLCLGMPRIPDNIEILDTTCFLQKDLVEQFYIGSSLKTIEPKPRNFEIKRIVLNPQNPYFELENNCLFVKGTNILILGCDTSVIPERTEIISAYAFNNCRFKNIRIPASVKTIEFAAFSDCSALETVFAEEGLQRIWSCAFADCPSLKIVDLPNSLIFMGESVFKNCRSLKVLPNLGGIEDINEFVFENCGFSELNLPSKIQMLSNGAFKGCVNLSKVNLGKVETILEDAFSDCVKLQKVVMSNELSEIRPGAFSGCASLIDLTLSKNLKEIYPQVFENCGSLESISLPPGLRRIWKGAFAGCSKLKTIKGIDSVKIIDDGAFETDL